MTTITPETIAAASDFAALLLTNAELAAILEIPVPEILLALKTPGDPLGDAITKARLKTRAELHRVQIDLALRGSATAMDASQELLRKISIR